jgi:hypothetical protein
VCLKDTNQSQSLFFYCRFTASDYACFNCITFRHWYTKSLDSTIPCKDNSQCKKSVVQGYKCYIYHSHWGCYRVIMAVLSSPKPELKLRRILRVFQGNSFTNWTLYDRGPGSVVGIATAYGMDGPAIESQWGARFSAFFQTGSEAYPASCTRGTGSFTG